MKKLMFVAVAVLAGVAGAADYVWTGAGAPNDQWAIPGNWSVDGVACTAEDAYPHTTDDTATFNTDARVLVHNMVSIGELVCNATFTHVRDVYLQARRLSGSGKLRLANRGRFDFINTEEITVTTPIEIGEADAGVTMLLRATTGYAVVFTGPLSGNGTVSLEGNLKLAGDNSAFEGTATIHGASYVEFRNTASGSAKATWIYGGKDKKFGRIILDGDLYFGSFQQTVYGPVDFRVNLSQTSKKVNMVIGGNGEDSIVMGSWGDANNNNDRPNSYAKITKVGDETLKVYCPWHRLGTEIRGGVLEAIGPNALTGRNTKDISPIAFTGGTLKYGIDTTTDPANPMPVTTDWSHLVKDSTGAISVDTAGNDVVWTSESLANSNPDAAGFTKKGAGTLELAGTKRDGSWKLFSDPAKTIIVEDGTLVIRNAKYNSRFTLASKLLGKGALKIKSEEWKGGVWLQGTTACADFEGTLDWANELSMDTTASGFMMTNGENFEMPKAKMLVSGNPAEATRVMKGETERNPAVAHVTVGAFEHLHPTAQIYIERSAWTLNILGTAGSSYLNGTFTGEPVHVVKTGADALAIGPDFSAPEGSSLVVTEGVFELPAGTTEDDVDKKFASMSLADGVTLTGEGTFGDVDLAKHDLVIPVTKETADKAIIYTLLSATSVTGDFSSAMLTQLDALNVGEKHGRWKLAKVAQPDGTVKVVLSWAKFGFVISVR